MGFERYKQLRRIVPESEAEASNLRLAKRQALLQGFSTEGFVRRHRFLKSIPKEESVIKGAIKKSKRIKFGRR